MVVSKDKLLNSLFILIPFSLCLSTFLAEIISLIFTIMVFFFVLKKRYFVSIDKKFFLFLFLFHIIIFISSSLNPYPDLMLKGFGYIRFLFLYFVLLIFLINTDFSDSKNIAKVAFLLFFLVLFDAFIQFFFGKNFLGFENTGNRITGIFKDEGILGSFVIRFLPILLWFMTIANFNFQKNKNLFSFLLFFSLMVIYISAGRNAFFSSIIFSLVLLVFLSQLRKNILITLSLFLISIILINTFNIGKINPANRIFLKTFNQITDHKFHNKKTLPFKSNDKKYEIYVFGEAYHNNYKLALHLFENNFVKGVGVRGFRAYCRMQKYDSKIGYCSTHPHNTFLQIASELGLIGLTFYFIFLIFFLKQCYLFLLNKHKLDEKKVFLISISIASIFINFFPLAPAPNFFSGWNSYYYYFTLVLFIFSIRDLQNIRNTKLKRNL